MRPFREIGRALFVGTAIFIVLGLIRYFTGEPITSGKELLITFGYNQLYAVCLYMSNAYLFHHLSRIFKNQFFTLKNIIRGFLGSTAVTLVTILLIRIFTEMVLEGENLSEFIEGEYAIYYFVSFCITMVVVSIIYGVNYYRYKQDNKVKEQKMIAGAASAKFDALKNQLDPHFLFNSLNVLTSLIEENPDAATRFTTALSKVYRYVLEQKNKQLVTVEEELKFARTYMSLIKMRFEDSIVIDIPEQINNPDAKVVPLSLQLLLENAVKHNRVTPNEKLRINIREEGNFLVIQNNVQPKSVVRESSGVGLQNIKNRYYLVTDRPVTVENNQRTFSVSIPLLTTTVVEPTNTQKAYMSAKKYDRAKKKVEELKGFYIHFSIYLIMVPVFIYLNVISTNWPWSIFPIIGWGAGVSGHAMEVFNYNPFLGRNWEERKIRELMEKDD